MTIRVREWAADTADLLAFDRRVHAAEDSLRGPVVIEPRAGGLSPGPTALAAQQIRARYQLVAKHERPLDDPELLLLNDADALSFFALNSWGFLAYYGAEHSRKKVDYTQARMRPLARKEVGWLRLHPLIASWLPPAQP